VQALSSLVPLDQAAAVARAFSPASVMSSPHELFALLNLPPEVILYLIAIRLHVHETSFSAQPGL
jgi:hypothetical protein